MRRWYLLVLGWSVAACSLDAATPVWRKTAVQRWSVGEPAALRVDRVWFNELGEPFWNEAPLGPAGAEICDSAARAPAANVGRFVGRRTVMLGPRVDELRCLRSDGAGTESTLLGLDGSGAVAWRRPLTFVSGERRIELWLLGASPEGLVLSSFEVWSPANGATLVPARTHPVGPEGRPVPDHQATGAAIYHPTRGEIFFFTAEVSLVRREGGLFRFDPKTGTQELLRPVTAGWMGTHHQVEAMALAPGGRQLLLARRSTVRDASPVSFAAFDLDLKRYDFEERHGTGHACSEPRVSVGPKGQIAFSYRDESRQEHVLVTYEAFARERASD